MDIMSLASIIDLHLFPDYTYVRVSHTDYGLFIIEPVDHEIVSLARYAFIQLDNCVTISVPSEGKSQLFNSPSLQRVDMLHVASDFKRNKRRTFSFYPRRPVRYSIGTFYKQDCRQFD